MGEEPKLLNVEYCFGYEVLDLMRCSGYWKGWFNFVKIFRFPTLVSFPVGGRRSCTPVWGECGASIRGGEQIRVLMLHLCRGVMPKIFLSRFSFCYLSKGAREFLLVLDGNQSGESKYLKKLNPTFHYPKQ